MVGNYTLDTVGGSVERDKMRWQWGYRFLAGVFVAVAVSRWRWGGALVLTLVFIKTRLKNKRFYPGT